MHATGGGSVFIAPGPGAAPVDIVSLLSGTDQRVMALVGWDTVTGFAGGVQVSSRGEAAVPIVIAAASDTEPLPSTSAATEVTTPAAVLLKYILGWYCTTMFYGSQGEASSEAAEVQSEPQQEQQQQQQQQQQRTRRPCRRRRRRIPPSIATDVLEQQRQLVAGQKKMIDRMTALVQV
ncbi:ras guanine nucleotide exchange factor P-like [Ornithodoros turicata]|uniref:ras guanine nucleotide exchange factor P-like n=1 Tax=Ornithodoros turicata TaxID=34597 RepID=UPI00313922A2